MADTHLDRLLAELGERAQAEIDQAGADAAARADAIRADSASQTAARRTEAFAALDSEFAQRRTSALAEARRRARGTVLRAQHALVDRVLDEIRLLAAEQLAQPSSECGIARRSTLLRSYAATADVVVERVASGILLTADAGHLSIDDTVDAWLESERAAIAIDVCRALETSSC